MGSVVVGVGGVTVGFNVVSVAPLVTVAWLVAVGVVTVGPVVVGGVVGVVSGTPVVLAGFVVLSSVVVGTVVGIVTVGLVVDSRDLEATVC